MDGRKEGRKEGVELCEFGFDLLVVCLCVCMCMIILFYIYLIVIMIFFFFSLSLSLSLTHGKILLREKKKESFRQHDFLAPKFVSEILAYTEEEKNTD